MLLLLHIQPQPCREIPLRVKRGDAGAGWWCWTKEDWQKGCFTAPWNYRSHDEKIQLLAQVSVPGWEKAGEQQVWDSGAALCCRQSHLQLERICFFPSSQWRPSSARKESWEKRNGAFVTCQRWMQESRGSTSKKVNVNWHFRDQLVAVAFYQALKVTVKGTLGSCLSWRLTLAKTLQVRKPFQIKKWNIPQAKDCSGYISHPYGNLHGSANALF